MLLEFCKVSELILLFVAVVVDVVVVDAFLNRSVYQILQNFFFDLQLGFLLHISYDQDDLCSALC